MAWQAEVRESLRVELSNQNNWFNIIIVCNTVYLGCVFLLVSPPVETTTMMLNGYIFCLGVRIMLFTIVFGAPWLLSGNCITILLRDWNKAVFSEWWFAKSMVRSIVSEQTDGPQEIWLIRFMENGLLQTWIPLVWLQWTCFLLV